jgi:hypothetical protein
MLIARLGKHRFQLKYRALLTGSYHTIFLSGNQVRWLQPNFGFEACGCVLQVRLYEDEGGSPLGRATFDHSPSKGAGATSRPCTPLKEQSEGGQQSTDDTSVSWMDRLLRRKLAPTEGNDSNTNAQQLGCEQDDGSVQLPGSVGSGWTYEDELAHRPYR